MDVSRLSQPVVINSGDKVRQNKPQIKATKFNPQFSIDKRQVKVILDKIIRNTRLKYDITDELGYFVVKVIDKDTDKIIREIPSKELQAVHEHIERVLGLIIDEVI